MGLLDKLAESKLGLKGETPQTREGALPTSQLHAQGTGMKADHSVFDLDGQDLPKYADGVGEGIHASIKPDNSELDLNGQLPSQGTYRDNSPEGATF